MKSLMLRCPIPSNMTLGAEFNVASLTSRDWNTLLVSSPGMCSDLQVEEVEVYLLNSSFEKLHMQVRE